MPFSGRKQSLIKTYPPDLLDQFTWGKMVTLKKRRKKIGLKADRKKEKKERKKR